MMFSHFCYAKREKQKTGFYLQQADNIWALALKPRARLHETRSELKPV